MSQQAVYEILKKERVWLSNEDLAKKLKQSKNTVNTSVRKLYEFGFIAKDVKGHGRRMVPYYKVK